MKSIQALVFFIVTFTLKFSLLEACFSCNVDPDATRSFAEIIESRGFVAEIHYVITEDGYILSVYRIVNPKFANLPKKPVILQHGLFSSGVDWLINAPGLGSEPENLIDGTDAVENNLGFALALRGYDVWLSNSRGNTYARNHTTLNPDKDRKFWDFSFDEMIKYDLPAVIKTVQKASNSNEVAYVGHSQGTLIMFGLLSEQPKYAEIIKPFIALAPVARVGHIKSPIRYLSERPLLELMYLLGGAFLPNDKLIHFLAEETCYSPLKGVCENLLFLFCGFDSKQVNETRIPVYFSHVPAGTSSWNMVHWGQEVNSQKFAKFDYGKHKNKLRYGTPTPPEYNLRNITSKHIAILHSLNDWLADVQDVQYLQNILKDKIFFDYQMPDPDWNHIDFLWSVNAGKTVNTLVVNLLKKYSVN